MIKELLKDVVSSNLSKCGYNEENLTLYIVFNTQKDTDEVYAYKNVQPEIYNDLVNAPSIGSYFYRNIRDKYDFELINIEQ